MGNARGDEGGADRYSLPALAALVGAALQPGEHAWLVGGAVRDLLLGRPADDVDLAVAGDVGRLAGVVAAHLRVPLFAYSERFSTYRVVAGARHLDFAPLRGATIADDLAARDFTVNALAVDVRASWPETAGAPAAPRAPARAPRHLTPPLIDPLGGRDDLAAGRLRLCAPDALTADPVRVVRLARLACGLALRPAPGVEQAAAAAAGGLLHVSGERVERELSALLGLPRCVAGLRRLDDCGALRVVLPEVAALKAVPQNPYHHLDVFEHTLEALDHLPGIVAQLDGEGWLTTPEALDMPGLAPLAPLAYAVLVHDLGKPAARRVDAEGHVMFWHHDEIGARLAAGIARRLKMSRRFERFLVMLVRQHLRLGFLVREQPLTRRALARYRRDVEPFVFESVVLSLADRMATRGPRTSLTSVARHFRLARDVWDEIPKVEAPALLDGADVMRLLRLPPGPVVGEALAAVREETEAGELHDAAEAARWLQAWWARRQAVEPAAPTAKGRHA
jgi:poly(A) polymerase